MSASRIPTLRPSALRPSARLTAVVDLPTPPLPEATAMIASTPGTPCIDSPREGAGLALCGGGRADGPPALRPAVHATRGDRTCGNARTICCARLRTGCQALTSAAPTVVG